MGEARYAEAINYFRSFPLWLELPEVLVVHAGVDPLLPIEETDHKLLMGVNSRRRPGFDGLSPWWFEDPRLMLTKPVVFGHHVFPEVARGTRGNVWGINTGAGYGGQLTGLLLPEFKIVSVPTANHFANMPRRWEGEEELRKVPLLPWNKLFKLLEAPDKLPPAALALMEEAQEDFDSLVARLTEDARKLRSAYKVDELSDDEKRTLFQDRKGDPRFTGGYGSCILQAMKGHNVRTEVLKQFPTHQHMRDAASASPV